MKKEDTFDMVKIGVITKTHGLKGEVKVYPTSADIKEFDSLDEVYLLTDRELITIHIDGVKYFKNLIIVKFREYDRIEDVEGFRKCELFISREDAYEIADGDYLLYDVTGCEVYDESGERLGIVTEVMETPANDVFVIELADGSEALFPVIDECILDVDTEGKKVTAHVMKGLL